MDEEKNLPLPELELPSPLDRPEIAAHSIIHPHPIFSLRSLSLLFLGIIIGIVAAAGGIFLALNSSAKKVSQYQTSKIIPSPTITPSPTANPAQIGSDWKTYIIKTIGLQFKLPPSLTKLGNIEEEINPGQTGTQLCVTFPDKVSGFIKRTYAGGGSCVINHFGFGTISNDYSSGRGGAFTDFQGYKIINGIYYANSKDGIQNEYNTIRKELLTEITNKNNVKIVKIRGTNPTWKITPDNMFYFFPREGEIGALVNTNNKTYPGITVLLYLKEGYTETEFDQILSTFKFLQ